MAKLLREDLPWNTWFVKVERDSNTLEVYAMLNDYMGNRKVENWTWRSKWLYPKPKNLEKAILKCQQWCDRRMKAEKEAEAAMVRAGYESDA